MSPGYDVVKSSRVRSVARKPFSTAGIVTSRRKRAVVKPCTSRPSATSAATAVIFGPTAASITRGGPYGLGSGVNIGVISVW